MSRTDHSERRVCDTSNSNPVETAEGAMNNDATIKFRLPSTELKRWKARAGGNLSAWIREMCNEGQRYSDIGTPTKKPNRRGSAGVMGSAGAGGTERDSSPISPRMGQDAGACPHHKRRGELCYKCDPKFGKPEVR